MITNQYINHLRPKLCILIFNTCKVLESPPSNAYATNTIKPIIKKPLPTAFRKLYFFHT